MFLGNISRNFEVDLMKNAELYGYVHDFLKDYESIDVDDILHIHKYLIKKNDIKQCSD